MLFSQVIPSYQLNNIKHNTKYTRLHGQSSAKIPVIMLLSCKQVTNHHSFIFNMATDTRTNNIRINSFNRSVSQTKKKQKGKVCLNYITVRKPNYIKVL